MSSPLRRLAELVLVLVLLVVGIVAGVALDRQLLLGLIPPGRIAPSAASSFGLMAEAWNVIQRDYVDRQAVVDQNMTYGAISGMVNALGDTGHSRFLTPEQRKQEEQFTQGEFEGIGAYVENRDNQTVVISPIPNSPAEKAGIKAGDIILKVNGEDVQGLGTSETVKRIVGPPGTSVTLTLQDGVTGQVRDVTVQRARITIENVTWQQLPESQLFHIRLEGFSTNAGRDLRRAMTDIEKQNPSGLILDLRSNPGGLLDEALNVGGVFLGQSTVLQEKDVNGSITSLPGRGSAVLRNVPMVVLVDAGTGSAAEIIAGALQDSQRAQVVGEKTVGTGTVLLEFPLSDGSSMLLATREWLTPKGRVIWHQGIEPDVMVQLPVGTPPLFPLRERGLTAQQVQTNGDVQLLKAIEILKGLSR